MEAHLRDDFFSSIVPNYTQILAHILIRAENIKISLPFFHVAGGIVNLLSIYLFSCSWNLSFNLFEM